MQGVYYLILVAGAGVLCMIGAIGKHRDAWKWFLLGLIAPPIGVIGILAVPYLPKESDLRDCPHCAERIKGTANVCHHCGRDA